MLHTKPPHLPAADLGLTEAELSALLWVTERLEDGRIGAKDFTMRRCERFESGVPKPCCIGAHMGVILGNARYVADDYWGVSGRKIGALLFPPVAPFGWGTNHPAWDCTPPQAASACRQFLQTGAVDWDAAIKGAAS